MTHITKQVFDAITDPGRETVNVTQWCKRENCWISIQAIDVLPVSGFDGLLVSASEHRESEKQAQKDRTIDNSINAQIQVLNFGDDYWSRALEWAQQQRLVGSSEITLLKKASRTSTGIFLNDKQCDKLLEVREQLLREGFAEEK